MPLLDYTKLFSAKEDNALVGVCSVYRGYSNRTSVTLSTGTSMVKRALLEVAFRQVPDEFITLCDPQDADIFREYAEPIVTENEVQMVANQPKRVKLPNVKVSRVGKEDAEELDRFYREQNSYAWTPLQLQIGPFYCIKQNGKIVSAAGTHLKAPRIAHIGSVATAEAYRKRGFALACTGTLALDLASKGRIISLFVRKDNKPAIGLYEKLGFRAVRKVDFVIAKRKDEA